MNDDVISVIKSYAGITSLDIATAYWKWYPELKTMKNTHFKIKQIYLLIQFINMLYKQCNVDSCTILQEKEYIKKAMYNNYILVRNVDEFSLAIAFHVCGYQLDVYQHYKNPLQCRVLNCSKNDSVILKKYR
jgi:vesicle coat complex subunit